MIQSRCPDCKEFYNPAIGHKCGVKVRRAVAIRPVDTTVHAPVHKVHKPDPVDNRVDTVIRELAAHGITLDHLEELARGEFALIPTAKVVSLSAKAADATTDRKAYKRNHERKRRAAKKAAEAGHATDTAAAAPSLHHANGGLSGGSSTDL